MIKILIAEDMTPILNKYVKILEKEPSFEVVAAVENGYEAIAKTAIFRPDIVLLDIEMETQTAGLDAASQILEHFPQTKIITLTVYEDDQTVFKAFQIGVCDYLLKNSKPQEIVQCIKDAYQNNSPIRPAIAQKIRSEFKRIRNSEQSFMYCLHIASTLTQTELDILDLTLRGYTRTQICEIRCVELSTVKTQIHNILKKFNMQSMEEVCAQLNKMHIFEYFHNINSVFPPKDSY